METRKTTVGSSTQMSTFVADLASIVRFNLGNFNTSHCSFVLDKVLQLVETPVTNPIIHSFSSINFPNSFKVFQYDFVPAEIGNNVLANVVVNPSHVTSFSAANLLQQSLSASSAFSLQFTAQEFELSFDLLDFAGIIKSAVASDGKIVYSEVNTQNSTLRATVQLNGTNLFRECEHEKTSTLFIHPEQTFLNVPGEIILVAVRDCELELLPGFEQAQYEHVTLNVSTTWEVVSDRRSVNNRFTFSFFNYTARLLDASDGELGWQCFSEMCVNERVEFNVIFDAMLPGVVDAELQGFSVRFDSFDYFGSCVDFDFCTDCCSHNNGKTLEVFKPYVEVCPVTSGGFASPPTTEVVGIRSGRTL